MRWSERLPTADLTFARLACGETDVDGLLDRLINYIYWKINHRSDSRSLRGTQVRDVVDSLAMKADGLYEIDLYFVPGGDSANEILSTRLHGLGYR
jgi:hypothetical protein